VSTLSRVRLCHCRGRYRSRATVNSGGVDSRRRRKYTVDYCSRLSASKNHLRSDDRPTLAHVTSSITNVTPVHPESCETASRKIVRLHMLAEIVYRNRTCSITARTSNSRMMFRGSSVSRQPFPSPNPATQRTSEKMGILSSTSFSIASAVIPPLAISPFPLSHSSN
jgi:deoxycytidylate deaminase